MKASRYKYEVQINNIKLGLEKAAIKTQLEAQEEFGQKLYDYIYGPMIEERYSLLNKVVLGQITQEAAGNLKAKHMKVTLENQSYEHCMEVRNIEDNIANGNSQSKSDIDDASGSKTEHYYCYNN